MDTVSGRICKYSRIAFRPPKDAYIEMPSLDSTTGRVLGEAFNEALQNCGTEKMRVEPDITQKRGVSVYSKQATCRFIKKSGHCNVSHSHVENKPSRYMSDIFTTCVDLRWRWNLLLFSTVFVVSWLVFAIAYWITSFIHGDFDGANYLTDFIPCVNNLEPNASFTSSFLFSLETQTTIGYGFRVVTEECPATVIFVVVQSVFGCVIDAFMIGLIMAKISRPKKRAETLLFSDKAVINMRDGQLCLMVRVGNLRKSHLVEATIRMQYLYTRETMEGEHIPLEQLDLRLDLRNDSDRLFLVTPQTICHPIDKDSPLYNLGPDDLHMANFEVIVILEGMVEATGMTTQARASYLPNEILWGHRFENVISFSSSRGYNVDFCKFNATYLTPYYPKCSAKDYTETGLSMESLSAVAIENGKAKTILHTVGVNDEPTSDGRDSGYTNTEDVTTCSNQTLTSPDVKSKTFAYPAESADTIDKSVSVDDVSALQGNIVAENNRKNLSWSNEHLKNSTNRINSSDSFKASQTTIDSIILQNETPAEAPVMVQPLVPDKIKSAATTPQLPNKVNKENIEVEKKSS